MAISKKQIVTLLSIYFGIGFMANSVYGDCTRPVFNNSYAILIHPDKDTYSWYERISINCTFGHERYALPEYSYCQQDGTWDQDDPTNGLCLKAQCVSNELVDSDINVTNSGGSHLSIVGNFETAYFSCATLGQFSGATSGTCYNGTFDYYTASDPQCLAYCPFVVADLGAGVSYTIGGQPVYNDTASNTRYYNHGATLDFTCDDGYDNLNCTGQTCESECKDGLWDPDDFPECHELDECEDNQCKNGATCEDLTNAYKCHCLPGYEGVDCEIDIDECANITCQNGASCEDGINSYECICAPGYTGDFCETDIDECSSNPCKNNSTCIDLVNEFNCSCAPGYQGVLCDEEIDECSSNPCQNNATCNDLFDEYECICLDGFNGTNCENNIDDCANHTCQNGATCIDKVATYECQCPDGYDGTNCENVITTPTMTTVIMTTDNTTSLGATSEPVLTTTDQDMTTSELTTAMPLSTTMMTDQTTMAVTSSKAVTTDKMTTLLGTTLPSKTLTTSTDSSTTSVMMTKTVVTTDTPAAATTRPITSDATTVTPDATTVTSGMTTISKGATAPTVPASTTESDSKTTSVMTTEVVATTDTPAAATTAITAATTVTPDATTNTADATTVSPGMTTISKETTAKSTKSPTEQLKTEKPPTTPLPCGGECLPTQVCNDATDECDCRPDYYEDEEDPQNPCKMPTSIDVTITITAVNGTDPEYKEEYADPTSEAFKALEEDVCQPFNEIYSNDNEYEGCRVIEFTEGSIIVNYVLTFVENSTIGVSNVTETVYEELQNPNGSFSGELTFNDTSLSVAPLDECEKGIDKCVENAKCTDLGENGYTCECFPKEYVFPGQECPEPTEPPPVTTEEPTEPGMEVWKVVVGVTVPIVSILTITIVGLVCWQYRRLDRTSPMSESTKLRTKPYQEDIGDSDRDASRPGSMMIMNNDGTVQEVVLPWRNDSSEGEFIFAPDIDSKGKNQMLPMVDYPSNYGPSSYDNDPLGNIVSSYDNYTYQNHDTRNTTEIDSRYF